MNWAFKIAAFLNRPPDYSLFPTNAEERGKKWIQFLLEETAYNSLNFSEVAEIEAVACGLDIPPFVEDKEYDPDCFIKDPKLIHPLSAQEYQLHLPKDLNEEAVQEHIKKVLQKIKDQSDGDTKKLFFLLWRLLPDMLAKDDPKDDPTKLGHLWKVLPADPRIPSHSIWDHASIASAIAGAGEEPALLLFTIASAQEMVATSRRTQDAWMGSFLLSYLSWQAIRVVVEECGPDAVIFPSLRGQPMVDFWLHKKEILSAKFCPEKDSLEIGNFPNLFTAIVPGKKAKRLAEDAEKAVLKGWDDITSAVKTEIEKTITNDWGQDISSWKNIWTRQTEKYLKGLGIFWVVCPWGTDYNKVIEASQKDEPSQALDQFKTLIGYLKTNGQPVNIGMVYHLLSSFAGKGLTARKNLRNFDQVDEPGHKCSLCGKWEAVHPDFTDLKAVEKVTKKITNEEIINSPNYDEHYYRWLSAFWEALGEIKGQRKGDKEDWYLKLKGRIRKGERLCSACLSRRFALEGFFVKELGLDWHLFPSTAGIATADYKKKILEKIDNETIKNYTIKVKKFIKDNDLPYPAAFSAHLKKTAEDKNKEMDFLKIDGDWLFMNSFDQKSLKGEYLNDEPEKTLAGLAEARAGLQSLMDKAKDHGLGLPPKYYAILALDGDNMGDWLTSIRAPEYNWLFHPQVREKIKNSIPWGYPRPLGPALQLALSDGLKNFSLKLSRKVIEEDHPGKLIYAGGDDLLAFLPLEHLFQAMKKLYLRFRGQNSGFEKTDSDLLMTLGGVRTNKKSGEVNHQGITVSMGVLIAHHTFPLYQAMHEVLEEVLKKKAKKGLGKNAFAIRLRRRGGEFTETGFSFAPKDSADPCEVLTRLQEVFGYMTSDNLSGRLAYQLSETLWAGFSTNESKGINEALDKARQKELVRITLRHCKEGFKNEATEAVCSLFKSINRPIISQATKDEQELHHDSWKTLADLLLILRFMAGKGE